MASAFVIMPFSDDFAPVFANIIQPALVGYDVSRADTRFDERGILEKIVTGIHEADLVIADITDTNANVMYELGVAHALGKPTIMIARTVANLPFDIRSYPVHTYSMSEVADSTVAPHLKTLAARHREGLVRFANPVTDFLGSNSDRLRPAPEPLLTESQVAEEINERAADIADASDAIGRVFEDFGKISERYGAGLAASAQLIRKSGRTSRPDTNPGICEAATYSRTFAVELNALAERYRQTTERVARALLWLVDPKQRRYIGPKAATFASHAAGWDQDLDDTVANLAVLRDVNKNFPRLSANLDQALDAAASAVEHYMNEIMTAKAYIAQIRRLASERA